jgi:hypothetical protein
LTGQSSSVAVNVRRYGTYGLAIHLVGFALIFISIGLVYQHIGIESGLAVLTPFADTLYGLGVVLVVAVAAIAGVPMKYLLVAGALIGIGLFYKSAPHEIHIASGIGFGLPHGDHIVMGTILITISVVSLAVLMFVYYNRSRLQAEKAQA